MADADELAAYGAIFNSRSLVGNSTVFESLLQRVSEKRFKSGRIECGNRSHMDGGRGWKRYGSGKWQLMVKIGLKIINIGNHQNEHLRMTRYFGKR